MDRLRSYKIIGKNGSHNPDDLKSTTPGTPAKIEHLRVQAENRNFGPSELRMFGVNDTRPLGSNLSVRVNKHDDHNLNLKISVDLANAQSTAEIHLFLFTPQTAHLRDFEKHELITDFFSRSKISTASEDSMEQGSAAIIAEMDRILSWLDSPIDLRMEDQVFRAAVRNYGSSIAQWMKTKTRKIRQGMLLCSSLSSGIADPTRQLDEILCDLNNLVKKTYQIRGLIKPDDLEQSANLKMLETYLHHLFVEALAGFAEDMERYKPTDADGDAYHLGWVKIQKALAEARRTEADRARFWLKLEGLHENEELQEIHMLRLSHLKNFFQSVAFVDITRKATLKKLTEPIAAFGAAFAALSVSLIEQMSHPIAGSSGMPQLGLQGFALISLGIALYTLRDRLKDRARDFTMRRLSKVVADIEQDLFLGGKKIGKISEWFTVRKSQELPEIVQLQRAESCISEPERSLNEDVIEYRKVLKLEPRKIGQGQTYDEVLRINFDRYLRFLDDRKKSLRSFDAEGNLVQFKSHRVYHFHLGVVTYPQGTGKPPETAFYRIVVDKRGIDRVIHV